MDKPLVNNAHIEVGGVPGRFHHPPAPLSDYTAPSLGLASSLEHLLKILFSLVIAILLLPLRLLTAIFYTPLCKHRYHGPTTPDLREPATANVADIPILHAQLKAAHAAGATRSYAWRVQQILGLRTMMSENEDLFFEAYKSDIGKPKIDWFLEKNSIYTECNHSLKNLATYMQDEYRATPLWMQVSVCVCVCV